MNPSDYKTADDFTAAQLEYGRKIVREAGVPIFSNDVRADCEGAQAAPDTAPKLAKLEAKQEASGVKLFALLASGIVNTDPRVVDAISEHHADVLKRHEVAVQFAEEIEDGSAAAADAEEEALA